MRSLSFHSLGLGGLVLALAATGCSESADSSCTPGRAESCACTDGRSGAQVCRSDGTFDACICTTPDAGADVIVLPGDADTGDTAEGGGGCPPDMVSIEELGVCIDRYEASQGSGGVAESAPGRSPWVGVTTAESAIACHAAGKRPCDGAEWLAACHGPSPGTVYPYGDEFDPQACNGMEYNIAHGNLGVSLTGALPGCVGGYPGLFDMSGNVWELTSDCDAGSCPAHGGHWIDDTDGLRCDKVFTGNGTGLNIGFRCCLDP